MAQFYDNTSDQGRIPNYVTLYLSTRLTIRTRRRIPFVSSIAVRVTPDDMRPMPIRIKYNRPLLRSTTSTRRALLHSDRGVVLCLFSADLLGVRHSEKREDNECSKAEHA